MYRVHKIAYMGLVVIVKKMSVLINFLLQNTKFVSAQILQVMCDTVTGLTNFAKSVCI